MFRAVITSWSGWDFARTSFKFEYNEKNNTIDAGSADIHFSYATKAQQYGKEKFLLRVLRTQVSFCPHPHFLALSPSSRWRIQGFAQTL
jgi:hypothetical protein